MGNGPLRAAGTSVGFTDSDSDLAVGYITNWFRGNDLNIPWLTGMSEAIRDACN